jgi:flagellar basal body-associated protein FliL
VYFNLHIFRGQNGRHKIPEFYSNVIFQIMHYILLTYAAAAAATTTAAAATTTTTTTATTATTTDVVTEINYHKFTVNFLNSNNYARLSIYHMISFRLSNTTQPQVNWSRYLQRGGR